MGCIGIKYFCLKRLFDLLLEQLSSVLIVYGMASTPIYKRYGMMFEYGIICM